MSQGVADADAEAECRMDRGMGGDLASAWRTGIFGGGP